MADERLTIGELSRSTGVATSALRYWEELGLLPTASASALVGQLLLQQDAGFTLRELKAIMAARADGPDAWRELARRKLAELDERIAQAQAARTAIAHGLDCPHQDVLGCPTYTGLVAARLAGTPLREAHRH
jgi:MerR family redox-sensitive transcriptional activator SoxR